MKVLHIGKYYPPYFGGIEKVNFDLVEGLNEFEIECDVLVFNHQKGHVIERAQNKYTIYRCSTLVHISSTPISLSLFSTLKRIISQYDIIHCHLPNPIASIALLSCQFSGKIVLHWHSDIVKQKVLKVFYKPFQSRLLKRADRIIVTSPNYLHGSKDLSKHSQKVCVIPIGIDSNDLPVNNETKINLKKLTEEKKVIFSLGRLIYYKGFEFLIGAAKHLPDDYIILIGGTGKLEKVLQQKIDAFDLGHKVKLVGTIAHNELNEYYRRADLFCLPSTERSEAFGVVLVEAMSYGLPLITTNIRGSGVNWVNQHEVTGLVVSRESEQEIANAIINITKNPQKHNEYSSNSVYRFEQHFTKKTMINKIIDLYKGLIAHNAH